MSPVPGSRLYSEYAAAKAETETARGNYTQAVQPAIGTVNEEDATAKEKIFNEKKLAQAEIKRRHNDELRDSSSRPTEQ